MNGSQYHAQQAFTIIRPSTQELGMYSSGKTNKNNKWIGIFILVIVAISITNLSYAGSSQPRIKGGNGDANGR